MTPRVAWAVGWDGFQGAQQGGELGQHFLLEDGPRHVPSRGWSAGKTPDSAGRCGLVSCCVCEVKFWRGEAVSQGRSNWLALLQLAPRGVLNDSRAMDPSHARIIDLYERHAQAFDADRGKSLFERDWLDRFRSAAGADAAILDVGCGSGEPIARYFIGSGHRVTGVDASRSLIGFCAVRFADHEWIVGDMRQLDLGVRFGGIIAWDSFFHLSPDDQRAMFPIFKAHAAPGAALMFTSGPYAGEAIGSYRGETLYHASLDPDAYEALLDANGFKVLRHVAEDATCGGRTVWRPIRAELSPGFPGRKKCRWRGLPPTPCQARRFFNGWRPSSTPCRPR